MRIGLIETKQKLQHLRIAALGKAQRQALATLLYEYVTINGIALPLAHVCEQFLRARPGHAITSGSSESALAAPL